MGVRGFLTYLESGRCPASGVRVPGADLVRQAEEHRARMGYDRDPVLVVDLRNFVQHTCGECLDSVCGGQHGEAFDRFSVFVRRLVKEGIRPVFVDFGALVEGQTERWIERQLKNQGDAEVVFERLRQGIPFGEAARGFRFSRFKLAGCAHDEPGCELVISDGDANLTAARVARERAAFGILADDTDYFFFPDVHRADGVKIFSCRLSNSNLFDAESRMTATMFDPGAISRAFNLQPDDMPYLASLIGNDYVDSRQDLRQFQAVVSGGGRFFYPNYVASVAQRIRRSGAGGAKDKARRILNGAGGPIVLDKVTRGVLSYTEDLEACKSKENKDGDPVFEEAVAMMKEKAKSGDGEFLGVMLGRAKKLTYRPAFTTVANVPSDDDVTAKLRRSIYGILLFEKPGALNKEGDDFAVRVTEVTKDGKRVVGPKFPAVPHPGLAALHAGDEEDGEVDAARWELFRSALDPAGKLDVSALKELDPYNLFCFCSLFVMASFRPSFLEEWEAWAMLAHHFELRKRNGMEEKPAKSVAPDHPDIRGISLASVYLEVPVGELDWALGRLTWPDNDVRVPEGKFFRHRLMDGFLLQKIYLEFRDASGDRDSLWERKLEAMETEEDRAQARHMMKHLSQALKEE